VVQALGQQEAQGLELPQESVLGRDALLEQDVPVVLFQQQAV
jgi:hypothetical protein